jgi:hypothetical protein
MPSAMTHILQSDCQTKRIGRPIVTRPDIIDPNLRKLLDALNPYFIEWWTVTESGEIVAPHMANEAQIDPTKVAIVWRSEVTTILSIAPTPKPMFTDEELNL